MRRVAPDWPPPAALKALRAYARNRPPRRLSKHETRTLPLSEIVRRGTPEDILVTMRARFCGPDGYSYKSGRCRAEWTWLGQAWRKRRTGKPVHEEIAVFKRWEAAAHVG
jgi:hypothetical protein